MEHNEIIEGNKLIAQFMGYTYFPHNMEGVKVPGWKTTIDTDYLSKLNRAKDMFDGGLTIHQPDGKIIEVPKKHGEIIKRRYLGRSHNDLKYYSDWNWMMEVLNKIESLGYNINILRETCSIYDNGFRFGNNGWCKTFNGVTKSEACWKATIEFIKMYNKNGEVTNGI
jgi:hypothetical protein